MSLRTISKMGHPILRQKARELTQEEIRSPEIQKLIDDMVETMRDADGVGLAAPQVYEGLRILTAEVRPAHPEEEDEHSVPLLILINPQIVKTSKEIVPGWEGCLSIPDIRGVVPRHDAVLVQALDRNGKAVRVEAEGFFARILQHEIDHLDGVLFFDRMEDFKTLTYLKEFERFWLNENSPEE